MRYAKTLRALRTTNFRLSVLFAAVFALSFAILIAIVYITASSAMRHQLRQTVEEDAQTLTEEVRTDGLSSIISDIDERLRSAAGSARYYYLADAQGRRVAGNLKAMTAQAGWVARPFTAAETDDSNLMADEDHELWGLGTKFDDGAFLFVGQDAFATITTQETILASIGWSLVIALIIAIAAGAFASRRFLSKIDAINVTSTAIMEGRRERIPTEGTADELDRLSANLNRLFDSNESLLDSLKQVTTNIAHDLRSPLSRLKQGLEASLQPGSSKEMQEQAITGAIDEADRLLAISTGLLRIAQIESGSRRKGFKPVQLSETLIRVGEAYRAVAEDQGKSFTMAIEPGIRIVGDQDLLVQMFANLVENAIHHTPSDARIRLGLTSTADGILAEVADSGPGIPNDQKEKVFERFYRLDASRATPGNGLGLSLVSAVAALHGIEVALEDNLPGLRAIVRFPAARI
jgi:signal transduction histidine kinase